MPINLQIGSIYLMDLGEYTGDNPAVKGREIGKKRPCIVVQVFENLGLVMVVPTTSCKPNNNYLLQLPTVLFLPTGTADLHNDSFVLCHQLRTLSIERVGNKIGELDLITKESVLAILVALFNS